MWRSLLTMFWGRSRRDEETTEERSSSNNWTPSDAWPPDYSSRSLAQDYQGDEDTQITLSSLDTEDHDQPNVGS